MTSSPLPNLSRVVAATILATVFIGVAAAEMPTVQPAAVKTLAGTGEAGSLDGVGGRAQFMYPAGVAYDARRRVVYVADSAGQRIRMIARDGRVTTIAGTGSPVPSGLAVEGGYHNGAARSARFSRPTAIVVGRSGDLFVADSFNHCIRRISNGRVDTYAGTPKLSGALDGPRQQATFTEPRGLALASDGTLYVADSTIGVRAISPSGQVSTLAIPEKDIFDVALWDRGQHVVFATTRWEGTLRYDVATKTLQTVSTTAQHPSYLAPYRVVALDASTVAVSSLWWQSIHVIRFGRKPGDPPAFSALVAGEDNRDWVGLGGYVDGTPKAARFYDPTGLALTPTGDIVVADGGNRRIRIVPAVHVPAVVDAGDAPPAPVKGALPVAIVGDSSVNWNWMNHESLAGALERELNAGAPSASRVRVIGVLTNNPDVESSTRDLVRTLAGNFRVVVWLVSALRLNENSELQSMVTLRNELAKTSGRLLIVAYPAPSEIGDGEETYTRLFRDQGIESESAPHGGGAVSGLSIPAFDISNDFVRKERTTHQPLFATDANRLSIFGNSFVAHLVAQRLRSDATFSNMVATQ